MAQSTPTNLQLTTVYPISSQLIQSLMNVVHSATNERWPFSTYQIRQQSICKGGPTTMDFTYYLKASITWTRKFRSDVICNQSISSLHACQPSPPPRPSPCLSPPPSTLPLLPLSPPVFIASISRCVQLRCPNPTVQCRGCSKCNVQVPFCWESTECSQLISSQQKSTSAKELCNIYSPKEDEARKQNN